MKDSGRRPFTETLEDSKLMRPKMTPTSRTIYKATSDGKLRRIEKRLR